MRMHANIGHEKPHYDRVVAAAYFKRTQNSSLKIKNQKKSITQ